MTADGKDEYVQNVGHGELFQDELGSWWAAVLGVRNEPGQPLGRETFLAPVDWPEGGWPRISQPAMEFDRHSVFGTGNKHTTSRDKWHEFCYVRNPDPSQYGLSGGNGSLITLRAISNSLSTPTGTMSFIGKRQRSFNSVATVTLEVPSRSDHPQDLVAGLSLYKDHLRHASIAYNSSASQIKLDIAHSAGEILQNTARKIASNVDKLGFSIVASPEKYVFFYKEGLAPGSSWVEMGRVDVQALHAREFTGPIFGIFATGENRDVVFRDFVVE